MDRPLRVLIVEDSGDDAVMLVRELKLGGYDTVSRRVASAADMMAALDQEEWDIVLAEYSMPAFRGTDALMLLKEVGLDLPFIFISDSLGEDTAVDAMRLGAHDYILKSHVKRLVPAVQRELREAEIRRERRLADEALRASNEALHALIQASPLAIVVHNLHGEAILWNPAAEHMFGWTGPEVLGRPLPFIPADEKKEYRALRERTLREGEVTGVEIRGCRKDASPIDLSLSMTVLRDPKKEVVSVLGVIADITERKRTELLLKTLARRQAAVAELGRRALGEADLDTLVNDAAVLIVQTLEVEYSMMLEPLSEGNDLRLWSGSGWKDGQVGHAIVEGGSGTLVGHILLTQEPLIIEDLQTETRFGAPLLLKGHDVVSGMNALVRGKDRPLGVLGAYAGRRRAFGPDDVNFLQAVANVLAAAIERKRTEEAIEHRAYHDFLTGLPNRALFQDRLRQAILVGHREQKPVAVFILDLDRFKEINDTLGHPTGDRLLEQIGPRLQSSLRESDTVARLGGDEFAVILPNAGLEGATLIAQKMLRSLETPFQVDVMSLNTGASIGIAIFPEHGQDVSSLMRCADIAMYAAKQVGHGYSVYTSGQEGPSAHRLALVGELRDAIERDELLLHYQPKVELKSGRVLGVEGLIHWQHPRQGLLPPEQFVPLAERSGLIQPLTRRILKEALFQCRTWHRLGWKIPVGVNLPLRALQDPELPDEIVRLLGETGLPADFLKLELAEEEVMADPVSAPGLLTRLGQTGVRFSIDQFGTAHTSMAYFKQLPVDEVKIDRSFIHAMMRDENHSVMIRSTVVLAHRLGFRVVAEGVENEAMKDRLIALGCDAGQGYYFHSPVPLDELGQWLAGQPKE